jgi:hypothetical protein
MNSSRFLISLTLALCAFAAPMQAAPKKTPESKTKNAATNGAQALGTFGEWGAYLGGSGSSKVCFVLSQPKERLPKGLNRDPAYVFISFRPTQGIKNEIAFNMGYDVKPASDANATIGSNNFGLISKDKNAFLKNAAEENQFVDIAKRASSLTVKGKSLRGNETIDRYALSGFGQALDRAVKECQ